MAQDLMTDDDILRFTQGQRRKLEAHLLQNGWPQDADGQTQLMSLWNDMDRQALGNKRIGVEQKASEADRMIATVIADVAKRFGAQVPFAQGEGGLVIDHNPPDGAEMLPRISTVPGEMDIGIETQNFNDFVKKFETE
jgi:hypothetical protein